MVLVGWADACSSTGGAAGIRAVVLMGWADECSSTGGAAGIRAVVLMGVYT